MIARSSASTLLDLCEEKRDWIIGPRTRRVVEFVAAPASNVEKRDCSDGQPFKVFFNLIA